MRSKKMLGMLSSVGLPLLFGVILFVLWQTQVLHSWLGTDTITLPLPTRISEIISQNKDSIGSQVKMTLIVALGGLVAGSLLGYLIAVVATIFRKWGAGGLTIVSAFNAIPIVALAPVINNWTRDVSNEVSVRSTLAKIIVVTISCTAALRVSVPASVIGALVTEYVAEDTVGVGRQIRENIVKGQYPTAWAYIATACAIGIGMYIILMLVERMVLKRRKA